MAKLSNINGKFAVEDTGAIRFSDQTGTTGQILKSNGNSAPTWVDPNTVGTGPWLPLAGGIVSGSTTFQSGLTVGGTLAVNGNLDVTSTSSDAVFLRSSQATTTNVYITNTNATVNNTANLYFAPANNIAGSYIKSTAIEDFSTSANRTSDLRFAVRKDGTFNEAIIINSSGNVGIGISPSKKLTVFGTGAGNATVQIEGEGGADPYINFLANNAQHWSLGIDDSDSDKFKLSEHSALGTNDYFVVDTSGNVGIGTNLPKNRLEVKGLFAAPLTTGSAQNGIARFSQTSGNGSLDIGFGDPYSWIQSRSSASYATNYNLALQPNGGNVGIGTTSPAYKLDVNGVAYFRTELYLISTTARMYLGSGTGYCVINKGPGITGTATRLYFGEDSDSGLTMFRGTGNVTVSSANVGIGTDSPASKLVVRTSTDHNFEVEETGGELRLSALNNARSANIGLQFAASEFNFLTGNVGIGTTSPSTRLSVTGSEDGALEFTTTLGSTKVPSGTNGSLFTAPRNKTILTGYSTVYTGVSGAALAPSGFLQFNSGPGWTGSQRNWAITSGYDIGGTQSGAGGNKLAILMGNTQNFNPELGNNGAVGAGTGDGVGTSVACYWDNALNMNLSASSRIRMGGGGSAGLPMLTPLNDKNTGIWYPTSDTWAISTAGDERMRITSGGDIQSNALGSGAVGYGYQLTKQSGYSQIYLETNATQALFVQRFYNPNGNVGNIMLSGSATTYSTSSDYRLKENVVKMTGALDRVSQLKPSRFNFIADADKTVDGFLAHEVQDIVPEAITGEKDAVDEDGNPDYQGIDQSKLVPLLVGAIQELEARIKILENK